MPRFLSTVRRPAILTCLVTLTLAFPAPARADGVNDSPPDGAALQVVTVNGSGCRPGTASVSIDPDGGGVHTSFDEYAALVGAGINAAAARRNCQFNLGTANMPDGYQFAVVSAEYYGFGYLSPGAVGLQRSSYYVQGDAITMTTEHQVQGAYYDYWQFEDTIPANARIWSPCHLHRNLNINTELRVSPDPGDRARLSWMSLTPGEDGSYVAFRLAWRRC
jgi:hypothetical protein